MTIRNFLTVQWESEQAKFYFGFWIALNLLGMLLYYTLVSPYAVESACGGGPSVAVNLSWLVTGFPLSLLCLAMNAFALFAILRLRTLGRAMPAFGVWILLGAVWILVFLAARGDFIDVASRCQ